MTAVERALRHIERLIAARTPKSAKHGLKTARKKRSEMPRVVSAPRRPTKPAAYNPEPAPVDPVALYREAEEINGEEPWPIAPALYVPPATPPPVAPTPARLPATRPHWAAAFEAAPPPPTPALQLTSSTTGLVARGSCKAVDADTGRQCRLPAHQGEHRSERGAFVRVLAPGAVPMLRQRLDEVALAGVAAADRPSDRQIKRESRERLKTGVRLRKSAHLGDDTTTGLERKAAEGGVLHG